MIVVGVTGTGGKSTVVNLIAKVLEEAGYKIGFTSGINFKIANKEWVNKTRMTMPGRFALQKLLRQMVEAGCQYAVVETTSEGIVQFRHLNIDYNIAVFTNLSREHIESHGSFENYKKAKGELFKRLNKTKRISIINLDDQNADYFLQFDADKKIGYGISSRNQQISNFVKAENLELTRDGSNFFVNDLKFNLKLLGEFNVYNALAAISLGLSQNIDLNIIKKALEKVENIPGRMEIIDQGQLFKVIIDYAHTPDSLEKVYQIVNSTWFKLSASKVISVLGSAGGGRDKSKRPVLGRLAAKYADYVVITNEDPYDEDPLKIINQIACEVKNDLQKKEGENFWQIADREDAIKKALLLAEPGDIVLITGKGCEQCIMSLNGKKVSWDDRLVTRELLKNLAN